MAEILTTGLEILGEMLGETTPYVNMVNEMLNGPAEALSNVFMDIPELDRAERYIRAAIPESANFDAIRKIWGVAGTVKEVGEKVLKTFPQLNNPLTLFDPANIFNPEKAFSTVFAESKKEKVGYQKQDHEYHKRKLVKEKKQALQVPGYEHRQYYWQAPLTGRYNQQTDGSQSSGVFDQRPVVSVGEVPSVSKRYRVSAF